MGIGSYYLFKSDQLEMTALQSTIKGREDKKNVSWNTKFAIRYGTTGYVFVINDRALEATLVSDSKKDEELDVIKTDKNGKAFEIGFGDGTGKIVLTANGRGYIDIVMTFSPDRYEETSGLCFGLESGKKPVPANVDMFKGNCKIPKVKFANKSPVGQQLEGDNCHPITCPAD
jgi:hypothetical protein